MGMWIETFKRVPARVKDASSGARKMRKLVSKKKVMRHAYICKKVTRYDFDLGCQVYTPLVRRKENKRA